MKVGNFFRNIFLNIKILWHSLFVGMKSADEKTMGMTKEGEITDNAIEEHISEEGVYADLLRGELTQEVMELRDSNYRGYKGSFDYKYIGFEPRHKSYRCYRVCRKQLRYGGATLHMRATRYMALCRLCTVPWV